MAAKEIRFHTDARERMLRGIDELWSAIEALPEPEPMAMSRSAGGACASAHPHAHARLEGIGLHLDKSGGRGVGRTRREINFYNLGRRTR